LLREAEDTATELLRGHRETLGRVIDLLIERETIDGSDLAAIVGLPAPADREPDGARLTLTMTASRRHPALRNCQLQAIDPGGNSRHD
jgi:cell division protease FtsH